MGRLPGFRDFPPEAMAARTRIFDAWRRVARRYGFAEYDGPPLEPLELYVRKSGAEIVEQLYAFTDKGGRDVALRPEMTPSLARILAERSRALPKPIRWFAIPQLFRYERQQRGRLREHFQWNADVVGEAGAGADAEVLSLAVDGLRELGLGSEDFMARVSDRRLLSALFAALGISAEQTPATMSVIDRLEREGPGRAAERLRTEANLGDAAVRDLLGLFETPGLEAATAAFGSRDDVGERLSALEGYRADLEARGLGPFLSFDLRIVRGLAYYTGIVFELFDRKGELRAICGGGRYDRLLELVGGESLPAVGFGMGDVVLGELLKDRGLDASTPDGVDLFLVATGPEQRALLLEIATAQRARGRSVSYALGADSVRRQFKAAGTAGAREVIVLGPEETARGQARVKDMASGGERDVALSELR
ncbi:MAG: histidine--tRNA ligase [Gemmatimonadetes bacterium]|nr:histidine--tRNA ligase [Gemmatimonadota bacterium]